MPELPEVETSIRRIAPALIGLIVIGTNIYWHKTSVPKPENFIRDITDREIQTIHRHGKWILYALITRGLC